MTTPRPHALVTGAGTGIGRAIAHRLAAGGHALTLAGRRPGPLEETAAALDVPVRLAPLDVADGPAVAGALAAAADAQGPLAVVVANAGIGGPNGPDDGGGDRFHELVATNLAGTYHTLRHAVPHLAGGPDAPARLVAVSSILARIGVPGYTGYCASKAGILGLVRALAAELAPRATVNAVCPGWVDTAMAREGLEGMAAGMGVSFDEAHALAMQQVPLGRMGTPDEVAGLVAWLASPDAAGTTGQGLDANGGAWMG